MKRALDRSTGKKFKTIINPKARYRGVAKLARAIRPCVEELELRQMLSGGQSPVAVLHGPYNVNEGDAITISGADSTDPDGSVVSYKWDFNYNPANGFHTQGPALQMLEQAASQESVRRNPRAPGRR